MTEQPRSFSPLQNGHDRHEQLSDSSRRNAPFVRHESYPSERTSEQLTFHQPSDVLDALTRQIVEDARRTESVAFTELQTRRRESAATTSFVLRLVDRWQLAQADACRVLGLDPGEALGVEGKFRPDVELMGFDVRERTRALIRIFSALESLFRDAATEQRFLREPNSHLNGEAPIQLLREGTVEGLLVLRDFAEWRARTFS